ncbi:hypothetical protein HZZ00_15800 [Streptomyces sp. NEAU-sy36]|uniref:hypothetical protein n=1 Tax=Streptomyces sp. NEAU-sy36 TaxID=2751189 RepID=UPI0015D65F47|nr:hypothetical protein [Streptomyces sp. NEAU-sy36]QLJ02344.1 hypothetical protein HZZ00_15800 [Streptomyces sp. NEAU-sy36]
MVDFSRNIVVGQAKDACARLCGASLGEAELVLLRQVFGLCVALGLRLRADCAAKGR